MAATSNNFPARYKAVQQKAIDGAYDDGEIAIAAKQLSVTNGYARSLGSFIDTRVRDALRDFAKVEGMPDGGPSNLKAVNRRLQLGDTGKYGVPSNRLRHNFILETSLTMKGWHTQQIRAWNNDGPSLIVRPTKLGGAYAFPPNPRKPAKK